MTLRNLNVLFLLTITLLSGLNTTMIETFYCSLHFIVDYPLWTLTFITRANQDYFQTNILLSTYIYRNVEGLNELYSRYRFPYGAKGKNITVQFFVHGITIVTQNLCDEKNSSENHLKNPLQEFCSLNINSDTLLDLIARYGDYHRKASNNEPACLYYGFTSRKLKSQNSKATTLGWSWRGHLCNQLKELTSWSPKNTGFNPRYSANVGVIAAGFDGTDYSLNKGEMTFFHEIGHSMNADHDDAKDFKDRQKECNPSDAQGGSYLMYPTGTEGLLTNNRIYSNCSLDTISKYTEILGRWKPKCLSTAKTVKSKCDGIFSIGEICDEHHTSSNCCTSNCKLKKGAACSPSAGLCCKSSCQFHPAGHQCHSESECKKPIECLGTSATCPDHERKFFKPDKTICRDGTLLCMNGSCELSICALYSLIPCQLKGSKDTFCMIACLQNDDSCVPYHIISKSSDSSKPLYFPYGSLCDSNRGHCDQFHKCLPLLLDDSTNPIAAGFSSLLLTDYSTLFKRYWWIFVLIILAQIILIPIVLLHFRSHCISSNNPFLE
ncbi:unnamed protein product [Rotaria magnacalcarata]|uniref:Uncharacterized protein n=2 Tax=Rotaria magnacalcarata TaxID=392030 RepID=A0A816RRB9_9BILA|nr:unnamed protein product [Rotaria magnacalcarata]